MAFAARTETWTRIPISSVEDLGNAVLGAGLRVTQMSSAPVTGSLAFATVDGITCSTGSIGGRVGLTGPLSESMVTVGAGLVMAPGTRHWLREVSSGEIGVFRAGDEHDALYTPGSVYVALTLSGERLEAMAADDDLVLDARTLGGTGIAGQRLSVSTREIFEARFGRIHTGAGGAHLDPRSINETMLRACIAHLGRPPRFIVGGTNPRGYTRIVARARAFIDANLHRPLTVQSIADAAPTSLRTLNRAFQIVLGETPYSYVLKLRLHKIRHTLVSDAERVQAIRCVARHWGIHEPGRFAGWYRELFGELPSQTLIRHRSGPAIL